MRSYGAVKVEEKKKMDSELFGLLWELSGRADWLVVLGTGKKPVVSACLYLLLLRRQSWTSASGGEGRLRFFVETGDASNRTDVVPSLLRVPPFTDPRRFRLGSMGSRYLGSCSSSRLRRKERWRGGRR